MLFFFEPKDFAHHLPAVIHSLLASLIPDPHPDKTFSIFFFFLKKA